MAYECHGSLSTEQLATLEKEYIDILTDLESKQAECNTDQYERSIRLIQTTYQHLVECLRPTRSTADGITNGNIHHCYSAYRTEAEKHCDIVPRPASERFSPSDLTHHEALEALAHWKKHVPTDSKAPTSPSASTAAAPLPPATQSLADALKKALENEQKKTSPNLKLIRELDTALQGLMAIELDASHTPMAGAGAPTGSTSPKASGHQTVAGTFYKDKDTAHSPQAGSPTKCG